MKKALLFVSLAFISATLFGFVIIKVSERAIKSSKKAVNLELKTGDIIFQGNDLGQSKAVRLATHSKHSHVGFVIKEGDETMVFEAVQPVRITPVNEWIKHGENSEYEVLRMKDLPDFKEGKPALDSLKKVWLGKNYDIYFAWGDNELYCSELVWKIYEEAYGVELCATKKMKDFDLTHPYVKQILKQRYGSKIPLEQEVVAPQDIYESNLLFQVH